MRIQSLLEKYIPLISNMLVPAFIYGAALLFIVSSNDFAMSENIFFHMGFYVLSIIGFAILINFNINRHLFFIIGNVLCYVLLNQLKREYGTDFFKTSWFNYLFMLYPLNLMVLSFGGKFRFFGQRSLQCTVIILLEYGVVEILGRHGINPALNIGKINILGSAFYFAYIVLFFVKSIKENNSYNYTSLYVGISTASAFYFAENSYALSLFFFVAQAVIVIDLIYTLIRNYFYDDVTGFYSRNFYVIKSKNFPFKYNLGIISIDDYDKLTKSMNYKKQKILTGLIAEVIQELAGDEVLFRYAQNCFVVLYKDKDNKEAFAHLDNIRRVMAGLSFQISSKSQPIKLTLSCGLAEKKRSDADSTEVLMRAEKAMQKALKFTHNVTSKG